MNEFEESGLWWDPRTPDARWTGTFRFDPDSGSRLTLTEDSPNPLLGTNSDRKYDVVLGRTTSGKSVSLLRCFESKSGGSLHGPRYREIFANAALIGDFHADQRDPLVTGVSAIFRYAYTWWGQRGIAVDPSVKLPNVLVRYTRHPDVQLYADDTLTIKLVPGLTRFRVGPDERGKFSFREVIRIVIETNEPRPLSLLQAKLQAIQDLLSVACQRYCENEQLQVYGPKDGRFPTEATFYGVPVLKKPNSVPDLYPHEMLFRFPDVGDRLPNIFEAWLAQVETLQPVRALYVIAVYGRSYLEGRFLTLVQALEAFHRRFRGGMFMDSANYQAEVFTPLKAAIPSALDADLRESLTNRVKFGNDYSLRKRLRLLFNEHQRALEKIVPDAARFIGPIVDRRNEMTHFPLTDGDSKVDAEEWIRYNFILRVLLELCFLKVMGFTDDDVVRIVSRPELYAASKVRWFT